MSGPTLRPGTVIDGYEVVSLLGRGGMGCVYRVRRGGSEYALKTLALVFDDDSEEVARFKREGDLLGALEHPGLVSVSATGHKPGFFYFVMSLIEGTSLEDHLKRTGRLPPEEAVPIMLAVADAIAHAHERGVIHRDLKPANILIEASTGRPIVTDFGLGRKIGEADAERLTRTGEILGTPSFVAPEQALGLKTELDEKTDVYGLGAVLYTMLSGRPPFEGPSALSIMKRVTKEPPPPLEDVPPELEAFVLRAMAKERGERPPSALAFAEELRAVAASSPLLSRTARAIVILAVVVLAATLLGARWWLRRAEELPRRVAALRATVLLEPLPGARAAGEKALADVPAPMRRSFARDRATKGQGAFAARAFEDARAALLDAWLATPDPSTETEALLAATLAELAAERIAEDPAAAASLREQARSARPEALPRAKEALLALVRARLEKGAPSPVDSSSWTALLRDCDAAAGAAGVEVLPEDCEHARLAARILAGRGSDADVAALTRTKEAALRAPPLALAVAALYSAALGAPDRARALERLEKIAAPPGLEEALGDFWYARALEALEEDESHLSTYAQDVTENMGPGSTTTRRAEVTRRMTERFLTVLRPFGRAVRANPAREPFPVRCGSYFTFVRLAANQPLLMEPASRPHWSKVAAALADHPLGHYVHARLVVAETGGLRARWPEKVVDEVHALAVAAAAGLARSPRTDHTRTLALEFLSKVLLDEGSAETPLPTPHPRLLEDAERFVPLSDYAETWGVIGGARKGAGDTAGHQAAAQAWSTRARVDEVPKHCIHIPEFLARQEENRGRSPDGR